MASSMAIIASASRSFTRSSKGIFANSPKMPADCGRQSAALCLESEGGMVRFSSVFVANLLHGVYTHFVTLAQRRLKRSYCFACRGREVSTSVTPQVDRNGFPCLREIGRCRQR